MSSYRIMFPGVRSFLVFWSFEFKPPTSGFQSYSYSSLKTSPSTLHCIPETSLRRQCWGWKRPEQTLVRRQPRHSRWDVMRAKSVAVTAEQWIYLWVFTNCPQLFASTRPREFCKITLTLSQGLTASPFPSWLKNHTESWLEILIASAKSQQSRFVFDYITGRWFIP